MLRHVFITAVTLVLCGTLSFAEAARIRSYTGECSVQEFEILDNGNIRKQKTLFLVPDGTECVEDKAYIGNENLIKDIFAKVVISQGTYKGKSGWVVREWLY